MSISPLDSAEIFPYVFIFVIFFAVIFWAFKKTIFIGNKGINAIASLSASALIIWWLAERTDYLDFDFSSIELSVPMIVLSVFSLFFLLILVKGVWTKKGGFKSSGILFGLAGLIIILGVSPFVFSTYYLPDWLVELHIPILIIGIVLLFFYLATVKKKDLGRTITITNP